MLNSTHTLVGLSLARTGLDRLAPHAVWTAVIAANLPDIDNLTQLDGTATYIAYHRGITHTAGGILLLSLALAAVMHRLCGRFRGHLVIALIAMATHPLLDYANTYGIRPWVPFADQWYYGDTMFVIDPYVDLILLAALAASYQIPHRRTLTTAIGLALVAGYVVGRVEFRNVAREHLAAFTAGVPGYQRSAVAPSMLTPLRWTGIVETDRSVFTIPVDVRAGVANVEASIDKAPLTPAIAAAERTRSARVFMGFARFPVVHEQQLGEGTHQVSFLDFRFYRHNSRTTFGAVVVLDSRLGVLSESISFNQPAP